jgi:(p)ppGpp synthase/HD superfamily hydrolase
MLSERFDDVLGFAARINRRQRRKGAYIPYVSHPLAVASLVIEAGGDEDQAIAALPHDAVEDLVGEARAAEIRTRCGDGVGAIILDCTDAPAAQVKERRERMVKPT